MNTDVRCDQEGSFFLYEPSTQPHHQVTLLTVRLEGRREILVLFLPSGESEREILSSFSLQEDFFLVIFLFKGTVAGTLNGYTSFERTFIDAESVDITFDGR